MSESSNQIAGAGIQAAGQLAGSLISARSSNKATKAQAGSNAAALAFQKQQDARSRADWDRAMKAWEVNRFDLMRRLGIPIPEGQFQGGSLGLGQGVAQAAPQMTQQMGYPGINPMQPAPVQPSPQDPTMLARSPMPGRGGPQLPYQMQEPRVNLEALLRGGYTGAPNRYGMR